MTKPSTAGGRWRPPGARTPRRAGDTWIELSVRADLEAVEAVSEILSRFAPGGTSVQPGFELIDEGLGARIDPNEPAIVRAYLPGRDRTAARLAVRQARRRSATSRFNLRPIGELEVSVVHEADWAHAWKAHFPVLRIGRRLVIRPTWRRHRRRPDDVVLALDPGMAFGTGLHPTTRLCLAGMERWADEGRFAAARVLDVGCGSGILMIAAGLFGAGQLVGVDTDPIAVEASAANAARNHLVVDIRPGSLPSRSGPFDLVVANLIASLLIALAGDLQAELRPGAACSPRASSSTASPTSGAPSSLWDCDHSSGRPRGNGSPSNLNVARSDRAG